VDVSRGEFYFLEMNARIQVEHPVTEAITGLDLIATQIAIAQGQSLALRQHDIPLHGHAVECRLNAEDIHADFRPSPGRVRMVWFPALPGLRVDTHMESGAMVPPHYDSLVAKLITHADTRAGAIALMIEALDTMKLDGIITNAPLHRAIMADPEFITGGVDTNYLAGLLPRLAGVTP
jgi:acetyl-CoA carboxylase, biotin carboxylase subunit